MPHQIKLNTDEAIAELKHLKAGHNDILAAVMADKVRMSSEDRENSVARCMRRIAALKIAIEALGGHVEHEHESEPKTRYLSAV
jgi:selenophosphate synthetase-related protein